MGSLKKGDVIDVVLTGITVVRDDGETLTVGWPKDGGPAQAWHVFWPDKELVTTHVIRRAEIENWPPRRGDVWQSEAGNDFVMLDDDKLHCTTGPAVYGRDKAKAVLYGLKLIYRRST